MKTKHHVIFNNSNDLEHIPAESVDLIVTSPPYPMIEMWDSVLGAQNPAISEAFKKNRGPDAFELMHKLLDCVWSESYRVLKKGGIACINIGDATRTINENFTLYQNHTRIMTRLLKLGFQSLPAILWRKQTNAPNKFMGSGMMPPGAYVTLEHEYILIVRKGGKREFISDQAKFQRRESAYFWEERNIWFSDVWMDLKGASQNIFDDTARKRSGAYPFELAYRLVNMFSIKEDVVMDPFFGLGTTMYAAMAAGRHSVGIEIDESLKRSINSRIDTLVPYSNQHIRSRIEKHLQFVEEYYKKKGGFRYLNKHYRFPVVTRQEMDLLLNPVQSVRIIDSKNFEVSYAGEPQSEFCGDWDHYLLPEKAAAKPKNTKAQKVKKQPSQRKLLG
jgi:modification methylase